MEPLLTQIVLDKGSVELLDIMGDDLAIVNAARVSYLGESKGEELDKKLLFYLMRAGHMSPFEQVELKFRIKCPMFVARQWFRHRTGMYNEVSRRYTSEEIEFFTPEHWRMQDDKDKQGSTTLPVEKDDYFYVQYKAFLENVLDFYEEMIESGVARELARIVFPFSLYTTFMFKMNARNLLHFLRLRMDDHAQQEIRDYAFAMYDMMKEKLPWTMEAFDLYKSNLGDD